MKRSRPRPPELACQIPAPDSIEGQHYYYVTLRPWPNLVFILPILILFEAGIYLRQGGVPGSGTQLVATFLIERVVKLLGAGHVGYIFPALAVIAILLSSHLAGKHKWRFDPFVLPAMLGESLLWTVPLCIFNRVLYQALLAGTGAVHDAWLDQLIRSLGAGLYEELVFRLICLTGMDILLVNVFRLNRSASRLFSILVSACLFAAQHHLPLGQEPFELTDFLFRTTAGIYLGGLFLCRGFGIATGCHVFYNVIVVTLAALYA
jgi:hypothetical protein